jgi:pimeloyl-ACP methyl ester carboxylesterase
LLASQFRCITLELPFGSHLLPMDEHADLSPAGCGQLIASALETRGIGDITIVGNDSGGAYSQIAVANYSDRVARLVLNSCETPSDEFPPRPFDALPIVAAHLPTVASSTPHRVIRALLSKPSCPDQDGAVGDLLKSHTSGAKTGRWASLSASCDIAMACSRLSHTLTLVSCPAERSIAT